MATKKPTASKTSKAKTTKSKTAAKTVDKPVSEALKTNTVEKAETAKNTAGKSCLSGFFAKKYDEKESVLTVFKSHRFYGALLGEVLGTALVTMLLFVLSFLSVQYVVIFAVALIAVYIAVYAFSGACLNPIVTAGMMASRRMSVIRGVMYIIAEVIGAWLGWLIFNAFHLAGGDSAYDVPTLVAIADGKFWFTAMVELFGAIVIAFFFARAIKYKRSVFTFAVTTTSGIVMALVLGFIVSGAFLGLNNNYIMNPAAALMYQIFPTAGESFGEIIGGVGQALAVYALFPMIGGVCGFYLSDLASKLSDEE